MHIEGHNVLPDPNGNTITGIISVLSHRYVALGRSNTEIRASISWRPRPCGRQTAGVLPLVL